METILTDQVRQSAAFPADLRQRWGERRLLELCLEAIEHLDLQPGELEHLKVGEFRAQMMLTLLTYCYASGIYGSDNVEWATRYDKTARYICARNYPDQKTIRQFRRHNRVWINRCLAYVLQFAWTGHLFRVPGESVVGLWLQSKADQRITAAVQEKLDLAVLTDMAMND